MTRYPDEMREELHALEAKVSELRLRQAVIINELDKVNTAAADGHRSMPEWVAAELDMTRSAATELVYAGRHLGKHRPVNFRLADGVISFDRAVATMRLAEAGADASTVTHSASLDLAGVGRLTARQRRVTRRDEHEVFADRYLSVQPTLDESAWRLSGMLPPAQGRIVEEALNVRADALRRLPGGEDFTTAQRRADALVELAMDPGGSDGSVTILVDLDEAAGTAGESGAEIAFGPRVGPTVLEELLCTGSVRVVGLDDGKPVVTSEATRAIPPAIRDFVARRDAGCTIEGCASRYRLAPHHIVPRALGGTHDPDNLTTLCWFHHHIAIHQQGFRIDPDTQPGRRRLMRAPPGGASGPPPPQ